MSGEESCQEEDRRRVVCAQFTRAALTPGPTTQGHRGQGLVYTFGEEMTLKAAEAIKMVLDGQLHVPCAPTHGGHVAIRVPEGRQHGEYSATAGV